MKLFIASKLKLSMTEILWSDQRVYIVGIWNTRRKEEEFELLIMSIPLVLAAFQLSFTSSVKKLVRIL